MRRNIIFFVLALALVSCERADQFSRFSSLKGRWYPDRSDLLTDSFVEFENGKLNTYSSTTKYPVSDGIIWNCTPDSFQKIFSSSYSIADGCLVGGGENFGKLSVEEDNLVLNGTSYHRLQGFTPENFCGIALQSDKLISHDCTAFSGEIRYGITRLVPGFSRLEASSDSDWIYNFIVESDRVLFSVSDSGFDYDGQPSRTGHILLTCKFAEPVIVTVTQEYYNPL